MDGDSSDSVIYGNTVIYTTGNTTGQTNGIWYIPSEDLVVKDCHVIVAPGEARKENMMTLFKVYVVDTKEMMVLREQTVIGKDERDALTDLSLEPMEQTMRRKGRLAVIVQKLGDFEKYAQKVEVEAKEDD